MEDAGVATTGPYPSIKWSMGLSILSIIAVIILGYSFSVLKTDQDTTDIMVHENNAILRGIAEDIGKLKGN